MSDSNKKYIIETYPGQYLKNHMDDTGDIKEARRYKKKSTANGIILTYCTAGARVIEVEECK